MNHLKTFENFQSINESQKLFIQDGQDKDIRKKFPNYDREKSEIIAEAGLDKGKTFYGSFLVKIGKHYYRFEDGEYIKQIK